MFVALEMAGVLASGTFGVLLARRARMDFVGVFSVCFITALGGGTLRDLLLDRHPLFWIEHPQYPVILFVLALVLSLLPRVPRSMAKWLNLPDALGLGFFTVVGVGYAMEAGCTFFISSLFGVITGVFGGVMSDVICNEVPRLFRAAPLYATCSFAGAWTFLLLDQFAPVIDIVPVIACIVVTVVFRFAALRWNWQLPEYSEE
jgi:uncharacterized membrane protein YeiH